MKNKIIIDLGTTKGIEKKADSQSRITLLKEYKNSKIELFNTKDGIFIRKIQ